MGLFANIYRLGVADLKTVITAGADGVSVSDEFGRCTRSQTPIPGVKEKALESLLLTTTHSQSVSVKTGYSYELDGAVWILPATRGRIVVHVGSLEIVIGEISQSLSVGDPDSVLSEHANVPFSPVGTIQGHDADPQV